MSSDQVAGDAMGQAERFRRLLEASRKLGATLGLDELYAEIYQQTANAVEAPAFYLVVYDHSRDLARVVYCADHGEGRETDLAFRGSDSEIITTRKPAILNGSLADNAVMSTLEDDSTPPRSAIVAPLLHAGRVLGTLSAQSYDEDAYSDVDLELLAGLADVAAVALHNSQQFAELESRRREAEQLEEIGRALTSKLDPDQVVGLMVNAVMDVLDVDGVAVWLRDPHDPQACRVADSGGDIAMPIGTVWTLDDSLFDTLVDSQDPVIIDDLGDYEPLPEDVAEHITGGSAVGVPLVFAEQVQGVLTAGSRQERHFGREHVAVLQRLTNQACVALGNAHLHANLHALSLTDPLTGLPNRRRLQIHLEHEVAAARRGRDTAIAVFDIDKFKYYNDTFGHIAGDEILKAIGSVLTTENRAMNVVARYGGDEFVSVLSDTTVEGARRFVERVQAAIADDETLAKFGISISIGCAEFDPDTMATVNDVLRAADADMYEQKAKRHAELQARA